MHFCPSWLLIAKPHNGRTQCTPEECETSFPCGAPLFFPDQRKTLLCTGLCKWRRGKYLSVLFFINPSIIGRLLFQSKSHWHFLLHSYEWFSAWVDDNWINHGQKTKTKGSPWLTTLTEHGIMLIRCDGHKAGHPRNQLHLASFFCSSHKVNMVTVKQTLQSSNKCCCH